MSLIFLIISIVINVILDILLIKSYIMLIRRKKGKDSVKTVKNRNTRRK